MFDQALNFVMFEEVGPWWNLSLPGAKDGDISTKEHRRNNGYTNIEDDHGGETKYGIAKAAHKSVNFAKLDYDGAAAIYKREYWNESLAFCSPIAYMYFDMAVNHGTIQAAKMLQRALHVADDGVIGKQTLAALHAASLLDLIKDLSLARATLYLRIVAANPSQAKFKAGWIARNKRVREQALQIASS